MFVSLSQAVVNFTGVVTCQFIFRSFENYITGCDFYLVRVASLVTIRGWSVWPLGFNKVVWEIYITWLSVWHLSQHFWKVYLHVIYSIMHGHLKWFGGGRLISILDKFKIHRWSLKTNNFLYKVCQVLKFSLVFSFYAYKIIKILLQNLNYLTISVFYKQFC